ncbi:hypothetical protein RDABS01_004497 [Bienertia sinuspersici]
MFEVQSVYFVELQGYKSPEHSSPLKDISKANVPPKIKSFGWRVVQNGLPVMENLKHRGIEVDFQCPLCGDHEQSILHMLIRCHEAELIRKGEALNVRGIAFSTPPPPPPWLKVNVDAAIFEGNKIGIIAVVRDYMGDVVVETWKTEICDSKANVAEALAMRHALATTLDAGFHFLTVESDCLKLIHHLKKGVKEALAFRMIVSNIRHIIRRCSYISFTHVRRSGNVVAHTLAKLSSSLRI